ncbi:hypothetical protein BRC94_13240 [Halobacteriales archaeon QS_5_70_17]|nr:MAG: hypothetical protein BRC94_13240 [Halobacteriales archaeon QS_5_70_17]
MTATDPDDGAPARPSGADPSGDGDVDMDALYGLLADRRCRDVLTYLREAGGTATFAGAVAHLADGDRSRVAAALCHACLPRLRAAGAVETEGGRIELTPPAALEWLLAWSGSVRDAPSGRSLGEWFSLLRDGRRRRVLGLLREHNVLSLGDAAEEIAVEERGEPITAIPRQEVLDVYFSLYHDHVPRLADAGVIEYDQESDTLAIDRTSLPVSLPGVPDARN